MDEEEIFLNIGIIISCFLLIKVLQYPYMVKIYE